MLEKLSAFLVDMLLNKQGTDSSEREICIYGLQTLIYSVVSTVWLLCLGFLFYEPIHACIIIVVFYICQTVGGGKHATTRIACVSIMTVSLCIGLWICQCSIPLVICFVTSSISAAYLLYEPLILHQNKNFLNSKKDKLTRKSRITTSVIFLVMMIVMLVLPQYLCAYSLGLLFSVFSRYAAVIENRVQRG